MKKLAILLLAVGFNSQASAQTHTPVFVADCRALVTGAGPGAENCRAMLEGAIGAFSLLGKDFYPVSAELGYCILPGTTPEQAARVIIDYVDSNPDCERLAHFSMCMNLAFKDAYASTCQN